ACVAYEAALEASHAAVGAYTARLAAEERRPEPDHAQIERWRAGQQAVVRDRDALDPADAVAVARARARFTDLAREIREG
uniref:hypothetical protein n=1 Tax=Frankia sp. Cr1 TaxID=3073931 RepID=UPI002AD3F0CC